VVSSVSPFCQVRSRLLDEVNEAVNAYDQAATAWGDAVMLGKSKSFSSDADEVRRMYAAVGQGWKRYWDHVNEHGC
jgi:hypothetical protein